MVYLDKNASKKIELFTLQKSTITIQMLAYGLLADVHNEYYKLGETTPSKCTKRFVIAIWGCFEFTYMRQYTKEDLKH